MVRVDVEDEEGAEVGSRWLEDWGLKVVGAERGREKTGAQGRAIVITLHLVRSLHTLFTTYELQPSVLHCSAGPAPALILCTPYGLSTLFFVYLYRCLAVSILGR